MPYRKEPLVTEEIYHIYNRGVARNRVFREESDYKRFVNLANYYQYVDMPGQYGIFERLKKDVKAEIWREVIAKKHYRIEVMAYCLMPNHFHFLVKQKIDLGITDFFRKVCNGYSHYFNLLYDRVGSVFQGPFKAVRVQSQEQITHLSRYIHLNPYTSGLVSQVQFLDEYKYSSYPEYLGKKVLWPICQIEMVLGFFGSDYKQYEKFVKDNADYQRSLGKMKAYLHEPGS